MASDEKVNDSCMCCIDQLRWQHIADIYNWGLVHSTRDQILH